MAKSSNLQIIATEVVVAATGKPKIFCEFCCVSFGTRGNLYHHLRKFHQLPVLMKGNQTCGLCDKKFRTIALLHDHLQSQHSVTLKFVDETFYSQKDFLEWKNKIEKESLSSFIIRNSSEHKPTSTTLSYYICHRSGQCKTKQNRVRHVKASGSIKSGSTCPAVMKVSTQTIDGISEIKVQYQSVHIGHDLETRTLRLTKEDRANLASCLKIGMSMDSILEQARQNFSPTNRFSFLTRKHLHNIRRDFRIPLNIEKKPKRNAPKNNDVEASDSSIGYEEYVEIEVRHQEAIQTNEEMRAIEGIQEIEDIQANEEIRASEGIRVIEEIQANEEIRAIEGIRVIEETQEHDKDTAVSSLLLLQNHNYSEDFKNRKQRIVDQLKKLQLRIEEWDPACPLPDAETHIGAVNALLDISSSSNGTLHLEGTLPVGSKAPKKPAPKRRKVAAKKVSKKTSVFI